MTHTIPDTFTLYMIGPFDSKFVVDNTTIARDYVTFHQQMYATIAAHPDDWEMVNLMPDTSLYFSLEGRGQGVSERPESLLHAHLTIEVDIFDKLKPETLAVLAQPPVLKNVSISHHVYGIGIVEGWLDIQLQGNPGAATIGNAINEIVDRAATSEGLREVLRQYDQAVAAAWQQVQASLKLPEQVFAYQQISHEQEATVLYGHAVSLFDVEVGFMDDLPFGPETRKLVIVGHPEGIINMSSGIEGFIHMGWGMSSMIGVSEQIRDMTLKSLRRAQFEWLTGDQLNQLLTRRLDKFVGHPETSHRSLRKMMNWVEKVSVEVELYQAHRSRYLQLLNPHSYHIYKHIQSTWRMLQQITGYTRKLESLDLLYQQAEAALQRRREEVLNRWVLVLTFLTLISAVNDALALAWPDYNNFVPAWTGSVILGVLAVLIAVLYFSIYNRNQA